MAQIGTHIKGDKLQDYADRLMDAGFTVWVSKPNVDVNHQVIPVSWFMYEKDGYVGIVSEGLGGFSHVMPVRPTPEDGSAITMFEEQWTLHTVHAEKVAQPSNIGKYNGGRRFRNEGLTEARKDRYIEVFRDPEIMVPVTVTWLESNQYQTVVEVPISREMTRGRVGREKLRRRIEDALQELPEEVHDEALNENWEGPHVIVDDMKPIWDAVQPPVRTAPKV
ncbi:hypothetical protein SEA_DANIELLEIGNACE_61 [Arthrobacter phage DanielleIgnace]|nr:hypothetical protein SEA_DANIELLEIGNACE_61 [Arthrobacter phage DanielleIgnace]